MRQLREVGKDEPMTPKQATINRWVGQGLSYETACARWKQYFPDDRDG